jgi:DNA-binding beta-propeller fold protein YncE
MAFQHQLFAAAAVCTLAISGTAPYAAAQQTTADGIRAENAVNRPERPYRPAGSSDPRDAGPHIAKGFGKRDRRLVYVTLPGGSAGGQFSSDQNGVGIVVLDVDRNFEFVKRIPTWNVAASVSPEEVSGVAASGATNMIYLATRGRLAAFDLATDQKVWEQTYDGTCCERPEVTPDGKTLVVGSDLKDFWYVINAQDGALKGKIQAPKSNFAHNMGLSADGKTVFMAPNGVTMTVGDVPSMKALKTITFSDHIRPFVINHDATRVYANVNNLLGFEIADVKTGEVIKRIEAPAELWKAKWADVTQHFYGHACPSHGIALTPDESELWVVDNINYGVLVYDNTGEWPVLKTSFPTTASADWITIGIGGQYAYLSSGDVVDVKTKKIVAQMKDEYGKQMHSEKLLEISFSNGKLVRTVSQFAQGIPSAVQARLSARGLTAQAK